MSLRPFRNIDRKKTKVINVGDVKVGGDNPISVQSMTNTLTTNVSATIKQIQEIHEEGADIVRVSCPDEDSSKALKEITKNPSKNQLFIDIVDSHKKYAKKWICEKMAAKMDFLAPLARVKFTEDFRFTGGGALRFKFFSLI